jgi:cytochrome c peroxidase
MVWDSSGIGGRLGALLLLGCTADPGLVEDARSAETLSSAAPRVRDSPLLPLPPAPAEDQREVAVGKDLFFSPLLSEDGKVSCGSCHKLEHGLADFSARSAPAGRTTSATNATTLFNIRYLPRITWSGAFDSLEAHLDALIQNPKLMGSNWVSIAARLQSSPAWVQQFGAVFPEGISPANARAALLAYERSLVTPHAAFDRWLTGDDSALGDSARKGYALFIDYGCASCHQGALVGGNMFQRLGIVRDYFADHPSSRDGSLGRYAVTRHDEDRYVFRVPSLRNVALTAPYLHDGSVATLEGVIATMGTYQLGWELPEPEVQQLAAFLESLTGRSEDEAP